MKHIFFLCFLFVFIVPLTYAQIYQVKVQYKNGLIVNIGSSNTVQRISTGYDYATMRPSVWITEQTLDWGQLEWRYVGTTILGSDEEVESISFIPEEDSKTICQYLQEAGTYSYTLRLLEEFGYRDRLHGITENFTLFVADDNLWRLFFTSAKVPVKNYEELTQSQKAALLKLFAYSNPESRLSAISSDYKVLQGGKAFRKSDFLNINDTSYVAASELPKNAYWNELRQQGGALLSHPHEDASLSVIFTKMACENSGIKEEDLAALFGTSYNPDARIYFSGIPVHAEVQCRNGYVYALSELKLSPQTIDEELREIKECTLFSSFLDRFTIPVKVGQKEGGAPVYRKGYFAQNGTYALKQDSEGAYQPLLLFDPSWRNGSLLTGVDPQENMGVIFAPTDQALQEWWDSSAGKLVMNGYENWEQVPNELLSHLVNNQMKASFLQSVPSRFGEMLDDENRRILGVKKEDIVGTYSANNGIIYVVNKVYTPDRYIPVFAPCLNVDNLKIMGWAVANTDKTTYIPDGYGTYLNSREHCFSFVAPTDEALKAYVDPFYVSDDGSYRRVSFSYAGSRVTARSTIVDKEGNPNGKQEVLNGEKTATLLKDILENSIIVMDQRDWSKGGYYKTKGGSFLNISAFREGATVLSGGNTERSEKPTVSGVYNQSDQSLNGESGTGGNGVVLAVDKAIQPTLKSVIQVLNDRAEFREFALLLAGKDDLLAEEYKTIPDSLRLYQALILPKTGTTSSLTSRSEIISFLGNYNYTLYVPTNEAIQEAYAQGLPKWANLESLPKPDGDGNWKSENEKNESLAARKKMARKIMDFIRFHFQYTSVCTDADMHGRYKTNAFRSVEHTPYELDIQCSSGTLDVHSLASPDSKAKTVPSLCNNMAREYLFNGAIATATKITTSPHVVIHGIDASLFFSRKGADGSREQFK